MKLNIVPARLGIEWVRAAIRTFGRQPLAMTGLFLLFMVSLSVVALVPVLGGLLALALIPALTVGLMAAARECDAGRFPMPLTLFVALRQGSRKTRAMLVLGVIYLACAAGVLTLSALADGGTFAKTYLGGGGVTRDMVADPAFRTSAWIATLLYLPVSLMFWHAPALVHWHDVPPIKSLFFSAVAVLRNMRAFLLYGALWMALAFSAGLVLIVLATLLGSPVIATGGLLPAAMLVATLFFTSLWFTFRDSFDADAPDEQPPADGAL